MQLPSAIFGLRSQNFSHVAKIFPNFLYMVKKTKNKNILVFWEMELSSPKLKILYLFQEELLNLKKKKKSALQKIFFSYNNYSNLL